jgi:hypothetical protein
MSADLIEKLRGISIGCFPADLGGVTDDAADRIADLEAQLATARAEGYADGVRDAGIACGNSIVEYVKTTRPDDGLLKLQILRVRMEKAAKALLQPDNGQGGDA